MSSRWLKGGIAIHRRWALGLASETAANRCYRLVAAWKPPRARNGQPVLCRLGQHRGAARAFFRQGPMEWDKLSSWAWRVVDRARQRGKMQRGIEADLLLLLLSSPKTEMGAGRDQPAANMCKQATPSRRDCRDWRLGRVKLQTAGAMQLPDEYEATATEPSASEVGVSADDEDVGSGEEGW
eukprot:scaffold11003_cov111-Isochrysis_galbana.AAC.2